MASPTDLILFFLSLIQLHVSFVDGKYSSLHVDLVQQALRAVGAGVGDEELAEVFLHERQQAADAKVVQFIKNIVQKQDGFEAFVGFQNFKLGQLEGDDKRFL